MFLHDSEAQSITFNPPTLTRATIVPVRAFRLVLKTSALWPLTQSRSVLSGCAASTVGKAVTRQW